MMYSIPNDLGELLDVTLKFDNGDLIFNSSGGKKGSPAARNLDYGEGLRRLFERVHFSTLIIKKVVVETKNIMHLSERERTVYEARQNTLTPIELYSVVTAEMKNVGQRPGAKGGNSRKRLRIVFSANPPPSQILKAIKGVRRTEPSTSRLTAQQLNKVTSYHIWLAVQDLRKKPSNHNFGPSTKYDVMLEDNERLPAKAVFGKALEKALGVLALPEHFSDLDGSICNMALSDAGYEIIAKGTSVKEQSTEISREDKVWTEGNMKRVLHLKRERQSGLASAKKEAFIDAHGRLFCERCQLEPIDAYGELGNACIEVHHIIPLSDNDRNPETKLDDLQCLCANCHRIVHKQMKENAKLENSLRSGTFDGWDWICHGED